MPDAPTDEIAQLRQQLQAMQAMATLGELTGTATHEFNNMLMTVINYAKMGLRNPDDATREKALTRILDVSQRAAKITATILAQARNRGDAFVPTDLAEIIRDAMILLEREMRKYRITVELELPEALPRALANGNQLQRVLLNLMINARQAMPEGGTLAIRLKHDEASGQLVLTVRDFGCGIAAEALPQIFEPFFTTKAGPDESGKGGTGLGLAACKEIIEAHQGRIRVESTVGEGTAFIIRLPIAEDGQTAAA